MLILAFFGFSLLGVSMPVGGYNLQLDFLLCIPFIVRQLFSAMLRRRVNSLKKLNFSPLPILILSCHLVLAPLDSSLVHVIRILVVLVTSLLLAGQIVNFTASRVREAVQSVLVVHYILFFALYFSIGANEHIRYSGILHEPAHYSIIIAGLLLLLFSTYEKYRPADTTSILLACIGVLTILLAKTVTGFLLATVIAIRVIHLRPRLFLIIILALALLSTSSAALYLTDRLGNIVELTDSSGYRRVVLSLQAIDMQILEAAFWGVGQSTSSIEAFYSDLNRDIALQNIFIVSFCYGGLPLLFIVIWFFLRAAYAGEGGYFRFLIVVILAMASGYLASVFYVTITSVLILRSGYRIPPQFQGRASEGMLSKLLFLRPKHSLPVGWKRF